MKTGHVAMICVTIICSVVLVIAAFSNTIDRVTYEKPEFVPMHENAYECAMNSSLSICKEPTN